MILHTIGDSHALYGWPMILAPGFEIRCHHLGARLMYSVSAGKLDREIRDRLEQLLPGDAVCFCFGEIDCRAHAHEHGVSFLAGHYLDRLQWLLEGAPPGPRMVMGVVPPQREPRPVHAGSAEERRGYVQFVNGELARLAPEYGFRFVNVYPGYSDGAGFMRADLAGHRGHIGAHEPLEAAVRAALGLEPGIKEV